MLVNQSPHMVDLLLWLMDDEVTEVSGYWANLNHPSVEVEDSAVAILRFCKWRPWLDHRQPVTETGDLHQSAHSWVERRHVSESRPTAARPSSPGCRRSRNRLSTTSGLSLASKPISRGFRLKTCPLSRDRRRQPLPRAADPGLPRAIIEDRPPLVTGDDGRRVVEVFQAIYESNRRVKSIRLPVG